MRLVQFQIPGRGRRVGWVQGYARPGSDCVPAGLGLALPHLLGGARGGVRLSKSTWLGVVREWTARESTMPGCSRRTLETLEAGCSLPWTTPTRRTALWAARG